jgi:uncharacterized protein with von Willebrand factor type A (vWA) domain
MKVNSQHITRHLAPARSIMYKSSSSVPVPSPNALTNISSSSPSSRHHKRKNSKKKKKTQDINATLSALSAKAKGNAKSVERVCKKKETNKQKKKHKKHKNDKGVSSHFTSTSQRLLRIELANLLLLFPAAAAACSSPSLGVPFAI